MTFRDSDFSDVVRYRKFTNYAGRQYPADLYKRNGIVVPFFPPYSLEWHPQSLDAESPRPVPGAFFNLTDVEARTFAYLLKGWSVRSIAKEEGVSRMAIYSRMEGKGGRGGMIEKNFWCWWVWHLRRRK